MLRLGKRQTFIHSIVARSLRIVQRRNRWTLPILFVVVGYWLLPIQGNIVVLPGGTTSAVGVWPRIVVEPQIAQPSEQVTLFIEDNVPWAHVKLVVNGIIIPRDTSVSAGSGPWRWRWQFALPSDPETTAVFYRDCHVGCVERGRTSLGDRQASRTSTPQTRLPTKLGVVFADAERNWHGRAGWTVELAYAQRPDDPDFGVDGLARRVYQASENGLRVLVRVAYDQRQSLPPADDEVALARYLDYCARLARDERFAGVYAYIVGSGYNTKGENTFAPDKPTTPEWYARVFNGYSLDASRNDNVVQTMQAVNPTVRVLVGPVTPWAIEQDGIIRDPLDQPWLNYFNTVAAHVNNAATQKSKRGIPLTAPSGFAFQAPGYPEALEAQDQPEREPSINVRHNGSPAQGGFRVYRDWLAIINRYQTTRGLSAYITSTNTWTNKVQSPPAQNYPQGWLTTALTEINREPQIEALCWFVDSSLGGIWDAFSLQEHPGRLNEAIEEFDLLLQR